MDLYSFFSGHWSFTRSIRTGTPRQPYAEAQGQASFAPDETQQLIFEERGSIVLNTGTKLQFSRSYRYVFSDDGLNVYFHDGPDKGALYQAYHHNADAGRLEAQDLHYCGPDVYAGHYLIRDTHSFSLFTEVRGTAKDIEIETQFRRAAADE
ncbi:MAG: hypothetical protein EOP49_50580 [Sphingobacteriales bacterium]|nr:MAG: hypothetical protein EOP49_50580 [Sphingobacteriales bacterium]